MNLRGNVSIFEKTEFKVMLFAGKLSPSIFSSSSQEAKMLSILSELGINPDGSGVPLTLTEFIVYGNQKNRLLGLLNNSRRVSATIVKKLKSDEFNSNGMKHGGDAILLQYFILEHFDVFKKYCLSKDFFVYDDMEPESVDPVVWLAVWLVTIVMIGFFIYWILVVWRD